MVCSGQWLCSRTVDGSEEENVPPFQQTHENQVSPIWRECRGPRFVAQGLKRYVGWNRDNSSYCRGVGGLVR